MMAINCKCPFDVNCQLSECPMCFIVFTVTFHRIIMSDGEATDLLTGCLTSMTPRPEAGARPPGSSGRWPAAAARPAPRRGGRGTAWCLLTAHMVTSNCGVSSCWSQCAGLHGARVAAQLTGDGGSV